jgi:putative iron-regulated protein
MRRTQKMQTMHGVGRGLLLLLGLGLWGCGAEPAGAPAPLGEIAAPVMLGYANLVYATYQDASAGVDALDSSVMALTSDPTELSLGAARSAWIAARAPYGSTEAFRFYGGPIDDTDGPEGRINAWPMDEAYVDYVEGDPNAGIINDPAGTPTLDEATLSALNEKGGEKNIAAGYHAIEFLLWGQDKSPTGPGDRPFTDYVEGPNGTATNQTRRGEFVKAASALLRSDLHSVEAEWAPETGAYRKVWLSLPPEVALGNILKGMGSLSGAELAGERMQVAYDTKEQEDEHSCFSDNTLADLISNARGIEDVYLGRHGSLDVNGLDEISARRSRRSRPLKAILIKRSSAAMTRRAASKWPPRFRLFVR